MELKELMEGFAAKIGLTDLAPGEDGAYALSFNDMDVGFTEDEPGRLLIAAPFATKPAEGSDRLAEVLLSANHLFAGTAGATIALNAETGEYLLQRHVPLALTDVEAFYTLVEGFVNTLETYGNLVREFRPVFDKAADMAEDDRLASSEMSFSGFMQV